MGEGPGDRRVHLLIAELGAEHGDVVGQGGLLQRGENDPVLQGLDNSVLVAVSGLLLEEGQLGRNEWVLVQAPFPQAVGRPHVDGRMRPEAREEGIREMPVPPLQDEVSSLQALLKLLYLRHGDQGLGLRWSHRDLGTGE